MFELTLTVWYYLLLMAAYLEVSWPPLMVPLATNFFLKAAKSLALPCFSAEPSSVKSTCAALGTKDGLAAPTIRLPVWRAELKPHGWWLRELSSTRGSPKDNGYLVFVIRYAS